jgi:hypothetical protein
MEGADPLPDKSVDDLQREFNRTEDGFDVHVIRDERVPEEDPFIMNSKQDDLTSYADEHFDHQDLGYYYSVLSSSRPILYGDSMGGVADWGIDAAVIHSVGDQKLVRALALHEITHLVGVEKDEARGVDSTKVSYEQYPSVMNYNWGQPYADDDRTAPIKLSDGSHSPDDFDDIGHINDNFTPPSTSNVDLEARDDG